MRIVINAMVFCMIVIVAKGQSKQETFDDFSPKYVTEINKGKSLINYGIFSSIPANTGKWIIPKFYNKDIFRIISSTEDNDSYLGRVDVDPRGRGVVYAFNNSEHKISSLGKVSFDYLNKVGENVEKNLTFCIWGVKDPEKDGWENQYTLAFGGKGQFADNTVTQWSDKNDENTFIISNKQNIPPADVWTTYEVKFRKTDFSVYDWIFISFGHSFQTEPSEGINGQLFGIDNITIPFVE